jgi:hypothetical protein
MMGLHPSVPYRPIPGLVALFSRGHRARETLGHRTPTLAQPRAFPTPTLSNRRQSAGTSVVTVVEGEIGRGLAVRRRVLVVGRGCLYLAGVDFLRQTMASIQVMLGAHHTQEVAEVATVVGTILGTGHLIIVQPLGVATAGVLAG